MYRTPTARDVEVEDEKLKRLVVRYLDQFLSAYLIGITPIAL